MLFRSHSTPRIPQCAVHVCPLFPISFLQLLSHRHSPPCTHTDTLTYTHTHTHTLVHRHTHTHSTVKLSLRAGVPLQPVLSERLIVSRCLCVCRQYVCVSDCCSVQLFVFCHSFVSVIKGLIHLRAVLCQTVFPLSLITESGYGASVSMLHYSLYCIPLEMSNRHEGKFK